MLSRVPETAQRLLGDAVRRGRDRHRRSASSMLLSMVPSDGNDDALALHPEPPAVDDRTRTAEPLPSPRRAAPAADLISTVKLRDPDRYQILGEHGRGGLGRVSRAHDRDLGRDIAIKELITRGHVGEVRFVREALITARLEHPGIVPVYEAA